MNIKLNINDDEMEQNGLSNGNLSKPNPRRFFPLQKDSKANQGYSIMERSKRTKKTAKKDETESSINEEESIISVCEEEKISFDVNVQENLNEDIVMEGSLLYRYSMDQVEMDGCWSFKSEAKEKFSYLLLKNRDKITVNISAVDSLEGMSDERNKRQNINTIHICSANLHEAILIPNNKIFNTILDYISGEYHGFFLYYEKTIEDRFLLNFEIDDNQVRINGEGTNTLGNFNILGYINLYTNKDDLLMRNDINSECIYLGEFRITRIYMAFNPNENYRVIKSFQHRKKRSNEDSDSNTNLM